MNWKDSLTSIIRWTLPFSTCGWRGDNPLLTVANFVLHIGILAVLFYSAHNVMWDCNLGFSLPSLPDGLYGRRHPSYHSGLSGPRLAPTGSPGVKLRDPTGRTALPCCSSPASW